MGGGQSKDQAESPELRGSDAADDLVCDVCNETNKSVEPDGFCVNCSDYLCSACLQDHTKNRASRNHVLRDKASMPKQRPKAEDLSIDKCDEHSNEAIKFFCKAHKMLGCGSCMIINHRLCEGVEKIASLSHGLKENQEYQQFTRKLTFLQERSQNLLISSSANVSKAEECCSEASKSVKQLRTDLDILLITLEKEICKEAEAMKSQDASKLTAVSNKAIQVHQEVQMLLSKLTDLVNENQTDQAFIQIIKCKDKIKIWSKTLDEEEANNTVQAYTFETTQQIQMVQKKQAVPGKIKMTEQQSQN